jgi:hypothetical protein
MSIRYFQSQSSKAIRGPCRKAAALVKLQNLRVAALYPRPE